MRLYFLTLAVIVFSSCGPSVKYFIVRHAEKATPSPGDTMFTPNNPPLSPEGKTRTIELRQVLRGQNIQHIYSTNTIRTLATAEPVNELSGDTKIQIYNNRDSLDYYIQVWKNIQKGNTLIVGHSNTVDDIVNKLCGEVKVPSDLPDSEYDNLFIVKKKGNHMKFQSKTYGKPTD